MAEELQSGPMSSEEKELLLLLTSPHLKVNRAHLVVISLDLRIYTSPICICEMLRKPLQYVRMDPWCSWGRGGGSVMFSCTEFDCECWKMKIASHKNRERTVVIIDILLFKFSTVYLSCRTVLNTLNFTKNKFVFITQTQNPSFIYIRMSS